MALIAGPNIQKPQTPLVDARSDYEAYFTVVGQVSFNGTRSGPTASRPTSTMPGRWSGMPYFDTDLGKMVFLQSVNPDVWITWSGSAFTSVPIPPPLIAQGDLYTRNAANDTRLPIGTQGQFLTVNTSQTTFLQWSTISFSPLTTKGDVYTFSTVNDRLPVGTDGQVLTVSSGTATGLTWSTPGTTAAGSSPLTTKGDVYVYSTSDTRLPVGTEGQILTVASSQATGLVWTTVAAGSTPLTTKGDIFAYSTSNTRLPVGAHGQLLQVDSTQAIGLRWANEIWTMASKGTTESRANNSTLADDSALIFNMFNGSTYRARGMIFYSTAAAADFQYQLYAGGVSLGSKARILHWSIPPGSATPTFANNTNVGIQTSILGAGGGGCLQIEAVIVNDTGSTLPFSLQWAQNASDAISTSVMAGSYFEYMIAL